MKKYLLIIYDLILSIIFIFTNKLYLDYRKRGAKRLPLSTKRLLKDGIFPIIDHYYEPKFKFSELEKDKYYKRNLKSINFQENKQIQLLDKFTFSDELKALNLKNGTNKFNFKLDNGSFEAADSEIYYQIIRFYKPKKIIEVGCGHSTLISLEAIEQNKMEKSLTKLSCIEPYENKWLENLGINIIRTPLEDINFNWTSELESGDIFFLDSSHIIRPDGDVTKFYLEILPKLKKGVIVHIHDIFSPRNYLNEWTFDFFRLWNEQYLLEGILSNTNKYEILLSLNLLKHNHFRHLQNCCPYMNEQTEPASIYLKVL